MKIDLHVHTRASHDAISSREAVGRAAKRRGLHGVALTEHDVFPEKVHMVIDIGLQVIWGEEVLTREGEIIGLFLHRHIPPGLSPEETIGAIREQGGVTYLPHPLKQTGSKPWTRKALERILPLIDVVEVFNGRMLDTAANRAAVQLAAEAGALMGAGSDAHTPWEVGRAYVEMEAFDSPSTFLDSLRHAKIIGRPPSRGARILMNRFVRRGLRRLLLAQEKLQGFNKVWLSF